MSHVIDCLRILVVEDDEDSAELLSETFQERGHVVEVYGHGEAALAALSRFLPDVALLDVGLPDISGYDLARKIRALPSPMGALRLVALTGYGGDEERALAREAGFDAHFVKPVHPEVLVKAIENQHLPKAVAELAKVQDARDAAGFTGETGFAGEKR